MFTCTVLPELRLIHTKVTMDLDKDAILAVLNGINSVPGFDPTFDSLTDLGPTTANRVSLQELAEIARQSQKINRLTGKQALVTPNDHARFIYGRLYQAFIEIYTDRKFRVFQTDREALEWLGLPPDALP